jgi:universal stress protein E
MKRFKSILFVYDGEKESGIALKRAINLTQENEATLTVVEVIEEFPSGVKMAVQSSRIVDFQKTVEDDSRRDLRNVIEPIEKMGIQVKSKVLWGKSFIEIIKEVLRNNHDLVMISPLKKPRLKEMLFGSRTMHLLRKCPCPVWVIVSNQPKKYARILAAVDAAPLNDEKASLNLQIMELATSLAHMEKSEMHIVHCWEPFFDKPIRGGRSLLKEDEAKKLVNETRNTNKRWVNELVGKFDLKDLTHKVHILEGEAEELIPKMASKRQVDLVVMGTVCRTGLPGFFIGSTAEKILHKLECSVLAIKPEGFKTPVKLDE